MRDGEAFYERLGLRERVREKKRAAAASVLAGFVLTVLKLAAALATGSLGLLAEAAHSALDLGAAAVTWLAVRSSWRPPDADHHYGHGKVENLAALVETLLLVLTALWILYEAAGRLLGESAEVDPTPWAFVVMGLSIIVDYYRSRDLRRVARASGSQALEADALHFSTDIWSSAVVILGLIGVLVARIPGWGWAAQADSFAAAVVAVIVLVLSYRLGRRAVDILMDRAPEEVRSRIETALDDLSGVQEPPRIRVRKGGERIFADVELTLGYGVPVAEAEAIASRARARVKEVAGPDSSVMIQLKAYRDDEEPVRDRVAAAVAMAGEQAHDVTVREGRKGAHADLHLELPGSLTLAEAHRIADRVEARILKDVSEVRRVDIHLELRDEEPVRSRPLDPPSRESLEERAHRVADRVLGEGSVHDLMLTRTPGGVYLSCHCLLAGETPLEEAHALTDRLERELHTAIPELVRVAVHAEPSE